MSLTTVAWRCVNARDDASSMYHYMGADEWANGPHPESPVPPHFRPLVLRKDAEDAIRQLEADYAPFKNEVERRKKERGDYWLSAEGRAQLKETFDDREDGNAVRPLLDRLELLEDRIRQLGDI